MAELVQGVLKGSVLCRGLGAVSRWFSRQWKKSAVIAAFLSPTKGEERSQASVFYRLWELLHRGLCAIFSALRLDRLLEGSIFRKGWFWCVLAAGAAPSCRRWQCWGWRRWGHWR